MTPNIDHVLTCSITGLSAAATVTFKDSVDSVITNSLEYVINDGITSFSGGSQTATLTLKPAKLRALTSPVIYTCVASTTSPVSSSEDTATVTMLVFGKHFIQ